MVIIETPQPNWLYFVPQGFEVWLVKEKIPALVESKFRFDKIVIRKWDSIYNRWDWASEQWWVDQNGKGLDGSLLMKPIKGHIMPSEIDCYNTREINKLKERVRELEEKLSLALTFL